MHDRQEARTDRQSPRFHHADRTHILSVDVDIQGMAPRALGTDVAENGPLSYINYVHDGVQDILFHMYKGVTIFVTFSLTSLWRDSRRSSCSSRSRDDSDRFLRSRVGRRSEDTNETR